ncbi:hypothetical protein P7C70_g3360, partial [Phenoliferia sp. Uapishka_3]
MAPSATLAECTISADAPLDDILALLALRGGVVVTGALSKADSLKMLAEIQPTLDSVLEQNRKSTHEDSFFPSTTVKFGGVITRSDTFARKMVPHPIFHGVAKRVLSRRDKMQNIDVTPKWVTALPQVNVTSVLQIHPGAKPQTLHRDDMLYHNRHPAVDKWYPDREKSMLCFVALSKVTIENGGTLFVPGSHLMGDDDVPPTYDDALRVQGEIGDAFIMLSSTYHGGGGNTLKEGDADSVRTMAAVGYNIGYLRQEENQYLALDHEILKSLPVEVQKLAGWEMSLPMAGWVEFASPMAMLGVQTAQGDSTYWDENQED